MSAFTLRKDKPGTTAFTAKAKTGVLELEVFDAIGADFFGDGITASSVSDAIKSAGDFSSIAVFINSPGGSLFEGVAIYNTLKACSKPVNINVVGLCASAASLIACAGDTVTMCPGTQYMLHRAQGMGAGYSDDLRKLADTLDSVTDSASDIYVAKTGMKKTDVLALMAAETWLKPQQAVDKHFATSLSEDSAAVTNAARFDLSMFKNAPIELQVKTKEVDGESLTSEDFVWVGNPHDVSTWALPWHFSTEEKTQSHLRDALARFDQEEKIPESAKPEAHAKLVRLCKEHGIEVSAPETQNATDADFNSIDILRKRLDLLKRK
jgi:ATP-dependent protease ClpP protease subunit